MYTIYISMVLASPNLMHSSTHKMEKAAYGLC